MKPCPFCGRSNLGTTFTRKGTRIPYIRASVHCYLCGIEGPQVWKAVTFTSDGEDERAAEEEAWRLWDTRKQVDEGDVTYGGD